MNSRNYAGHWERPDWMYDQVRKIELLIKTPELIALKERSLPLFQQHLAKEFSEFFQHYTKIFFRVIHGKLNGPLFLMLLKQRQKMDNGEIAWDEGNQEVIGASFNLLLRKLPQDMQDKIKEAYRLLASCKVCPRSCGVNRLKGEIGFCKAGLKAMVSSFHAHFGEEPPISGRNGSGTIFFTHCSLRCVFCQNHPISQLGEGREVSISELAGMMLKLQNQGCHNINFVTPTHYMPQILEAIAVARKKGLRLPLVYNCGGYESLEALKKLDGVIDIYMPDMKYSRDAVAKKYSFAPDYFEVSKKAVKEMHRQVGDLKVDKGIAKRGLLIRHLVMPDGLAGSSEIFDFIVKELSPNTYVNIMAQYYTCHKAFKFPEISRRITHREYMETIKLAKDKGLHQGSRQVLDTINRVRIPEWTDNLRS